MVKAILLGGLVAGLAQRRAELAVVAVGADEAAEDGAEVGGVRDRERHVPVA